jgi:hypothetical protein
MSNPALPQAKNRHRSGAANGTKSTDKNFCALYPRNSLISLDSDERIQGNPRKSNPQNRGFSQRNGRSPRKPKRIDRTNVAAHCREGAKPATAKGKPALKASGDAPNLLWNFVTRIACLNYINSIDIMTSGPRPRF